MEFIRQLGQMVEAGLYDKSLFRQVLENADKEILQFSTDMNFVYQEPINIFPQTTDERLAVSVKKQNTIHDRPEIAIQECIKTKLSVLDDFIKKYHIGFIRRAEINENGYVSVEIPCSIHSSLGSDDKASAKATFDEQMRFLEEIGIDIVSTKHYGYRICGTEKNIKIIEKLLSDRDCKQIHFSIVGGYIDKIKFIFNVIGVNKFCETPIDISFETNGETLNEDEIYKVLKYAKEILNAKSSIQLLGDKIKNVCCSLIENYFSYICAIFDYNGEITRRVNGRHEAERKKNAEIRNIEHTIGNSIPVDSFKDILTVCKEKLNKFTIENLSFRVSEFSVDRYGIVCYTLHFTCSDWLTEYKLASEEYLRNNFKMSLGSQIDETLTMLDTYENKEKISKMLKSFCPTSRIMKVECCTRDGFFGINEIRGAIDDISNIL